MVIYSTPFGSFNDWIEAAEACEKRDLDPCTCIKIVRPDFTDVSWEFASYGLPIKLSTQVRVF